jgi:nucleotide-binding universal stress UspA family protein
LAIAEAARRAKREGAPLLVAHVASEQTFALVDASKVAEAFRQHVQNLTTGDAECQLLTGSPHAELIQLSDKRGASMVVLGASGAGGVTDALFGTTAENVVRYAHGPVLVVRDSPLNSVVVVGTDFSAASTPALRVAVEEAQKSSAELVVFHSIHQPTSRLDLLGQLVSTAAEPSSADISERQSVAQEALASLLEEEGVKGRSVVVAEPPGAALAAFAEQARASLIVVGTHGRTGLKRMALGSIAANVVRSAPCSVLVVR